ncbi:MAG: TonB-dependent receptor [Steroidobacteraceae bacterium]
MAGAFYTEEDNLYPIAILGEFAASRLPLPSVFGNIITSVSPSTYEEKALFGNATFYFNDAWDLTAGLRYSENEQTADNIASGLLLGIFGAPRVTSYQFDDDATTYLATLRWRPSQDVSTFLRAATGYRPGGPQTIVGVPSGSGYAPDEVTNYEAGVKAKLAEGRLNLAASVYRIDWDDIQLNTLVNGFLIVGNGGAGEVKGVEIELSGRQGEAFSWGFNLGYNDAKLTEIDAASAAQLGARAGDRLPVSPKVSASALGDYRFTFSEGFTGSVGATLKYSGSKPSSFTSATPAATALNPNVLLPSETVLDLRFGVNYGRFDAQFRIENATDEAVQSTYVTNKIIAALPVDSNVSIGRPRTFTLAVGVRF